MNQEPRRRWHYRLFQLSANLKKAADNLRMAAQVNRTYTIPAITEMVKLMERRR